MEDLFHMNEKKSPLSLSSLILILNLMSLSLEPDLHLQLPHEGFGALEQPIQEGKTSTHTDMWPDPGNPLQLSNTSFYVAQMATALTNCTGKPSSFTKA